VAISWPEGFYSLLECPFSVGASYVLGEDGPPSETEEPFNVLTPLRPISCSARLPRLWSGFRLLNPSVLPKPKYKVNGVLTTCFFLLLSLPPVFSPAPTPNPPNDEDSSFSKFRCRRATGATFPFSSWGFFPFHLFFLQISPPPTT